MLQRIHIYIFIIMFCCIFPRWGFWRLYSKTWLGFHVEFDWISCIPFLSLSVNAQNLKPHSKWLYLCEVTMEWQITVKVNMVNTIQTVLVNNISLLMGVQIMFSVAYNKWMMSSTSNKSRVLTNMNALLSPSRYHDIRIRTSN